MTSKTHDLYLLADGTYARPKDCERDADGILRHIYGMAVAMDADGNPQTVHQGAVDNKNVEAAEAGESPAPEDAKAAEWPPAPEGVNTLIDPATGDPAEETTAVEPEASVTEANTATDDETDTPAPEAKNVVAAPAKKRKTRDMGAGPAKTYKTR